MDLFGFKKRREERHLNFMKSLLCETDDYLLEAHSALDMNGICGLSNKYTETELRAVEDELAKRGYVDDIGHVFPFKVSESI